VKEEKERNFRKSYDFLKMYLKYFYMFKNCAIFSSNVSIYIVKINKQKPQSK